MKIEIMDLSVGYGVITRKPTLRHINLHLNPGCILVLYGPNGVGKTTLLRCLCGQLPPIRGSIWWNGIDVTSHDLQRRHRSSGNFEAGRMLYKYATLRENLLYNRHLLQSIGLEQKLPCPKTVGVDDLLDRVVETMSLGQQQRAALYVAMCKPAELYFFDEPDNGLDRSSVERVSNVLQGAAFKDSCIVVSTHDTFLVQALASDIAFLSQDGLKLVKRENLPSNIADLDTLLCDYLRSMGGQ